MPTVSIVIPAYNPGKDIIKCLDSLKAQTYTDFEAIIIDDGSTDGSEKICDQYASEDPRFRVIHKQNAGVSAARNQAMDLAQGQWVTFIDSDDWVDPEYLENMVESARNTPEADVVVNTKITINEAQPRQWKRADSKHFESYDRAANAMIRDYVPNAMWCYMIKKTHLADLRVDPSIHYYEDMEFLFRLFQSVHTCALNPHGGYHYRQGSVTHRKLTWKTLTAFHLVDKHARNGLSQDVCRYMDGKMILSVAVVGVKDPVYTVELNRALQTRAADFVRKKVDVGLGKKAVLYIRIIAWSPKVFYCMQRLKDKIKMLLRKP